MVDTALPSFWQAQKALNRLNPVTRVNRVRLGRRAQERHLVTDRCLDLCQIGNMLVPGVGPDGTEGIRWPPSWGFLAGGLNTGG